MIIKTNAELNNFEVVNGTMSNYYAYSGTIEKGSYVNVNPTPIENYVIENIETGITYSKNAYAVQLSANRIAIVDDRGNSTYGYFTIHFLEFNGESVTTLGTYSKSGYNNTLHSVFRIDDNTVGLICAASATYLYLAMTAIRYDGSNLIELFTSSSLSDLNNITFKSYGSQCIQLSNTKYINYMQDSGSSSSTANIYLDIFELNSDLSNLKSHSHQKIYSGGNQSNTRLYSIFKIDDDKILAYDKRGSLEYLRVYQINSDNSVTELSIGGSSGITYNWNSVNLIQIETQWYLFTPNIKIIPVNFGENYSSITLGTPIYLEGITMTDASSTWSYAGKFEVIKSPFKTNEYTLIYQLRGTSSADNEVYVLSMPFITDGNGQILTIYNNVPQIIKFVPNGLNTTFYHNNINTDDFYLISVNDSSSNTLYANKMKKSKLLPNVILANSESNLGLTMGNCTSEDSAKVAFPNI